MKDIEDDKHLALLHDLLHRDEAERDEQWETDFLHVFPHCRLNIIKEEPTGGPDGWPYLLVVTDPVGSEPCPRVLDWLSDKGIGLVVNPQKSMPDYVFTFGMLWNFKQTGEFLSNVASGEVRPGQVKFEAGEKVVAGPPTEEYLPGYARKILKEFFKQQGIDAPKILVMGREDRGYDFCVSVESLKNPAKTEYRGILESIAWFLPAHYSIVLVSEKGLPPFHAL
jgi:hypothetical protein